MFFGAYVGVTGFLFLIGLLALVLTANGAASVGPTRRRVDVYTVLTWAIGLACLLLFVGLSAAAGLMTFGRATSWSYPGDYLAAGPVGWALFGLSLLGVTAPLWALLWTRRRQPARPAAPRNA